MQPGDNYRAVVNADNQYLLSLENDDQKQNVGQNEEETTINKLRICDSRMHNSSPSDMEVLYSRNYCSDVLEVWRYLHIEIDSFGAIPTSGSQINTIDGEIVGITNYNNIEIDGNTSDGSIVPGRFENGYIIVGSNETSMSIAGNADYNIFKSGLNKLRAIISKSGLETLECEVMNYNYYSGLIEFDSSSCFINSSYINGSLEISGNVFSINGLGGNNSAFFITGESIRYIIYDDDKSVMPSFPNLELLSDILLPAYLMPLIDGGGDLSYNRDYIEFELNSDIRDFNRYQNNTERQQVVNSNAAVLERLFDKNGGFASDSETYRRNDYWVTYLMINYQNNAKEDGDPDTEKNSFFLLGYCGGLQHRRGSILFKENIEDYINHSETSVIESRVAAHELLHQFMFINDDDEGLYDYAVLLNSKKELWLSSEYIVDIRSSVNGPGR